MDYSYDYTTDLNKEKEDSRSKAPGLAALSKTAVQILAGTILLGFLLLLSSSLDYLFMNELITVSVIWGLVSLVRLQGEPRKNASHEER